MLSKLDVVHRFAPVRTIPDDRHSNDLIGFVSDTSGQEGRIRTRTSPEVQDRVCRADAQNYPIIQLVSDRTQRRVTAAIKKNPKQSLSE